MARSMLFMLLVIPDVSALLAIEIACTSPRYSHPFWKSTHMNPRASRLSTRIPGDLQRTEYSDFPSTGIPSWWLCLRVFPCWVHVTTGDRIPVGDTAYARMVISALFAFFSAMTGALIFFGGGGGLEYLPRRWPHRYPVAFYGRGLILRRRPHFGVSLLL